MYHLWFRQRRVPVSNRLTWTFMVTESESSALKCCRSLSLFLSLLLFTYCPIPVHNTVTYSAEGRGGEGSNIMLQESSNSLLSGFKDILGNAVGTLWSGGTFYHLPTVFRATRKKLLCILPRRGGWFLLVV